MNTLSTIESLTGVQRPAAFAIICFCFCEFRTVSYSGSCAEQEADLLLVFVLLLRWGEIIESKFCFDSVLCEILDDLMIKINKRTDPDEDKEIDKEEDSIESNKRFV